jgi:hypothetical protein
VWLLPVVPLVAGIVAVVVVAVGGDEEPAAIDIASSAVDFSTLDDLLAASDLVVVATVADITDGRQITAPADPAAALVTRLLVLDVSDVLAGAGDGDVIVEEPAALGDGTPVVVDGIEPLEIGDQAIWFLVAGDAETMPYLALVNRQGRYTITGDTLRPTADDPLSAELANLGLAGLADRVEELSAD